MPETPVIRVHFASSLRAGAGPPQDPAQEAMLWCSQMFVELKLGLGPRLGSSFRLFQALEWVGR